jgi:septal ring factor EnvC (AmiA/AmiB activator)
MDAYTIPEAARAAGLSPREVRMRIEEGDVRAIIRAGRRMVERSELERLVERQPQAPPPLRAAPPPMPSPHVVEDLVARLEEQALELARVKRTAAETRARDASAVRKLEQELGDARRELSRARARITELESDPERVIPRINDQRDALTPLFRRTELEPAE